jgi:hypothetical protein
MNPFGGEISVLDRVQSFLKSRARRTALTVVLLAAAVTGSARAAIMFSFPEGGSAFLSTPGLSVVEGVPAQGEQASSELGGVIGGKGFGSAVGTDVADGPGNQFLYFDMGGQVTGGPFATGQTLPLTWDFTVGTDDTKQVHYRIQMWLRDSQTTIVRVYDSGIKDTAVGGGTVTGNALADVGGLSPSPSAWDFQLQVYINGMEPGKTLTLDIPQNSIDINAEPSSGVPEPATWFLMVGGTGLLLIGRRWV